MNLILRTRGHLSALCADTTRTLIACATLAALISCDSVDPHAPVALVALDQTVTGTVGQPLADAPHFEARDERGIPVGGIPFTVRAADVTSGTVKRMLSRTMHGSTPVGLWILGTKAGTQSLIVEAEGMTPFTINATATAGAPANVVATVSPVTASGLINTAFVVRPSVKVTDAFGNPVAGVSVTATITGGGLVEIPTPITDTQGIATVGVWTLGTTIGMQTLTMTVGSRSVVFTANTGEQFNVDVRFVGTPPSAAVQLAFTNAAHRLEQVITAGLPSVAVSNLNPNLFCGSSGLPTLNETIDDIVLLVQVVPIDGIGAQLGGALPCAFRFPGTPFPYVGWMLFDSADVTSLVNNGSFGSVALHEMMHALGFGTIWTSLNLVTGANTSNPIFTGAAARTEYVAAGGSAPSGVPLENCQDLPGGTVCGAGTREVHWKESSLRDELMTGYLTGGVQPFSRISIASLASIGYSVSFTTADPFTVPPPGIRSDTGAPLNGEWEIVLRGKARSSGFGPRK